MKPPPSSSCIVSSIPELYPSLEWRSIQTKLSSIILSFLALSTLFILFLLHSSNPFLITDTSGMENGSIPNRDSIRNETRIVNNEDLSISGESSLITGNTSVTAASVVNVAPKCDMSVGKWVKDARASVYTNASCRTLPDVRNCGKYGKDQGYVYWRWKPDGCELPRFDPGAFLRFVRGKMLMFIGDSLARNQMESLLCLLSEAEIPIDSYKDDKDKHRTWYFPTHDFTLMVVWTEFLVEASEIVINGTPSNTFTINLDNMNQMWAGKLPLLDYAIINGGNWFSRRTYIHQGGKLIGCVHCWQEKDVPAVSVSSGVRMVFKAAFEYINECESCRNLLTLLRTYSMSHFENGAWFTGGYCNRTKPLKEEEVNMKGDAWEFRKIQMEEMEKVKRVGKKRFGLLDVTRAMISRADAHPGRHWIAKKTSDCLHWCLPGPVDTWNELLLEILKRSV